MSDKSHIQWTDATWNPVTGCSKVSAGCRNCYAERDWARLSKNPHAKDYFGREFTDVRCHPERLEQPLKWKKPRKIFVNSMSDLFHEAVPLAFINSVVGHMLTANWHTYQVLTKRPARMRDYIAHYTECGVPFEKFAPNVWLGVSVEDQATADERIPILLQTPAAVRFLSIEPLLGPVGLTRHLASFCTGCDRDIVPRPSRDDANLVCSACGGALSPAIHWVIVGGESGLDARPCNIEDVRSIVAQCKVAGVPCFVKQLGSRPDFGFAELDRNGASPIRDRKGGDPSEWPEDLRGVREFPSLEAR